MIRAGNAKWLFLSSLEVHDHQWGHGCSGEEAAVHCLPGRGTGRFSGQPVLVYPAGPLCSARAGAACSSLARAVPERPPPGAAAHRTLRCPTRSLAHANPMGYAGNSSLGLWGEQSLGDRRQASALGAASQLQRTPEEPPCLLPAGKGLKISFQSQGSKTSRSVKALIIVLVCILSRI